jgi:Lrp/AsnC family leucine-responsive transcriptional regulator
MDRADREILSLLLRDGRMSYRELGDRLHLSSNAVAERVRRLARDGIIRAFTIDVDPAAMGLKLAALIDLRLAVTTDAGAFEDAVRQRAEVRRLWHVTGPFDYQLQVDCEDAEHLDRVIRHLKRAHGVGETHTRVILRDLGPERWSRSGSG